MRSPTTVKLKDCCVERPPPGAVEESVTLTVKLEVPPVVGVPKIVPALFKDIPAGSVPLSRVHLRGCTPPAATKFEV